MRCVLLRHIQKVGKKVLIYLKMQIKNGKPTKLEEGESPAVWDPVVWATQNYVAGHNFVDGKHELLPIPLAEIQSNAQLNGENNPGYE